MNVINTCIFIIVDFNAPFHHFIDALTTKNKYGMLPLRTAIRSKASTEVIDALIRAAPSVAKSFGVSGKVRFFEISMHYTVLLLTTFVLTIIS